MLGSSFAVGDHVVASRDLDGWMGSLGFPAVKKGTRGIVRERPSGWFSDRYRVEFHRGGTVGVRAGICVMSGPALTGRRSGSGTEKPSSASPSARS